MTTLINIGPQSDVSNMSTEFPKIHIDVKEPTPPTKMDGLMNELVAEVKKEEKKQDMIAIGEIIASNLH